MFKKKPQIKNLSPLRSSDRRKLADQIIADFNIPVPTPDSNPPGALTQTPDSNVPTLASLRTSLLPESTSSARFTTTSGPDSKPVTGTLYVGAPAGHEERILWISLGAKEARLYPTVYTLWNNPHILPLLYTPNLVVDKLRTGADLMIPGLQGGPPWPRGAKKNAVVAVASLEKDSVPAWVGICDVDVAQLGSVVGMKGVAAKGVHWMGDEIWNWGQVGTNGGREAPDEIRGWRVESSHDDQETTLQEGVDQLKLDEGDDKDDDQRDGGVTLQDSDRQVANGHRNDIVEGEETEDHEEEEAEPSTSDIDHAFHQAFLYSLYNAKKSGSPPKYGLDLPIQPSFLISQMIQPHLRSTSSHYTIKNTSWKNTKKFIKHFNKEKLIKSKDRNGGETVILDVDFDDPQLAGFKPYPLRKPKSEEHNDDTGSAGSTADPSLNQSLILQTLYRPSSKLTPEFFPSKTAFYTPAEVATTVKSYIDSHPDLTTNTASPRFLNLNPFIANTILSSPSDQQILTRGSIARDVLQQRLINDSHLLTPYWLLSRSNQTTPSKPHPGTLPKVTITIEKRTGNKLATKISGLEVFGINPQLLTGELQKKCASSTSVGQRVGGKVGEMEVLVQGDQRDVVVKEVGRRGVQGQWVDVVDKRSKGK